jgi:hypothetical protein
MNWLCIRPLLSIISTLSHLVYEGIPGINDESWFPMLMFSIIQKGFVPHYHFSKGFILIFWRNHSLLTWLNLEIARNLFVPLF